MAAHGLGACWRRILFLVLLTPWLAVRAGDQAVYSPRVPADGQAPDAWAVKGGDKDDGSDSFPLGNGSDWGTAVIVGTGLLLAYGSKASLSRMPEMHEAMDSDLDIRRPGDPTLPYLQLNTRALSADRGSAWGSDFRLEGGYGPFAVDCQRSWYQNEADEDLTFSRIFALWRCSPTNYVSVGLGAGGLSLEDQDERHSGAAFEVPVLLNYKHVGVEFRPVWGTYENDRTVQQYDLAFIARVRYVAIEAGYRWLNTGSAALDGPFAGLTLGF